MSGASRKGSTTPPYQYVDCHFPFFTEVNFFCWRVLAMPVVDSWFGLVSSIQLYVCSTILAGRPLCSPQTTVIIGKYSRASVSWWCRITACSSGTKPDWGSPNVKASPINWDCVGRWVWISFTAGKLGNTSLPLKILGWRPFYIIIVLWGGISLWSFNKKY